MKGKYILANDVVIAPASSLPGDILGRLPKEAEGDHIIYRPTDRNGPQLVDEATRVLLEAFRTPASIADAIIAVAKKQDLSPHNLVEDVFPVLRRFIDRRVLLSDALDAQGKNERASQIGEMIDGFRLLRRITSVDDTNVYWLAMRLGERPRLRLFLKPDIPRTPVFCRNGECLTL